MIAGKSVLAVIPARGGSRGLPRKHVLPFRGRPLIGWTIAAAQASRCVDRLILSSDDPEIIAVAGQLASASERRRTAQIPGDGDDLGIVRGQDQPIDTPRGLRRGDGPANQRPPPERQDVLVVNGIDDGIRV